MAGQLTGRLFAKRRTRIVRDDLRRELATADIKTALTHIAQAAASSLGAIDGVVMIRRGDDLRVFSSSKEHVEPIANAMGRGAFADDRELPSVRVMRTGEVLAIDDVRSYNGPPEFFEACKQAGVRSVLCVPIRPWTEATGVLNLGFGTTNRFRGRHVHAAMAFAEETASVLERARIGDLEVEARRALTELDELKYNFLSSVANELQTPLTSIIGFSDLLLSDGDSFSEDKRRDVVQRIADQAHVLAGLVDDLLEARGGAAQAAQVEPLDLRMLVMKAVDAVRSTVGTRNINVQVPEGWNVWASASATDRVLESLLTNAAQFSPVRSTITITAMTEKQHAIVSVRDEGIGIDPKDQERIFDTFYRVHRTDSAVRGTGIGLSIARGYVEAMGGEMWVTSEVGNGSTFWFTLRLAPERDEAA
jgi:signal transduction histidine kinase